MYNQEKTLKYLNSSNQNNNKGRRTELTKLKHKKRCKRLDLKPEEHYCYKYQCRPCNCWACKKEKFSRKVKHKNLEFTP